MSAFGTNSGSFTYVNIKEGKIVIKKGDVIQTYDWVQGVITGITIRDEEYQNKKYKKLCINLLHDNVSMQLQMRLDSGYGRAFCNMIKNVDLKLPAKFTPTYSEVDGKKQSGMFINQNDKAIKWYFTKNTPHDLPPMEKINFRGEEVWDNKKQQDYYINMLLNEIVPQLPHAVVAGPPHMLDTPADPNAITEPVDDLPF